jgi:hypothetical protein
MERIPEREGKKRRSHGGEIRGRVVGVASETRRDQDGKRENVAY